MSEEALRALADRVGLATVWHDVFGGTNHVTPETLRALLESFEIDASGETACRAAIADLDDESRTLPSLLTASIGTGATLAHPAGRARLHLEGGEVHDITLEDCGGGLARLPAIDQAGYHRLELERGMIELAVAPDRAFAMADALREAGRPGGKGWGLAVQVYSLRREHDGGIGDFAALGHLARSAAGHGAEAIAISPVHALYASEPGHYGPYCPSSRIALNPVYAPVDCAPDAADPLVDWRQATPQRYRALRAGFARDRESEAFGAFRASAPRAIQRHVLFETLAADQIASGGGRDWRHWPESLRRPDSPAVARRAETLRDEVEFHLYAQFRAVSGLEAAQREAISAGMAVGLIADLAVGADPAGSDAWSRPDEVLRGVSVGAPPDEFNRCGQNWGLTAFSPRGLRRSGFSALRDMLAAALAPTGGVRIDHAMGLARLWLTPDGTEAKDGSYLSYPFEDMRRIVLLESMRHRGLVLAEDLGTVPEGFRERLSAGAMAGMSVLWFERHGDRFVPPAHWRAATAAMTTTHDLPTVAGWWRGTDIGWRERLGLAGEDAGKRAHDRTCLWDACRESGSAEGDPPAPEDGDTIADVLAAHVGGASSDLMILPIEDALALPEQPNIPGTIDEHPNWRRRLPGNAANVLDDPRCAARLVRLDRARGRA